MKKLITISALMLAIEMLSAQSPPPPPGNPSSGENRPVGGSAHIGSGIVLLIALSVGYSGKMVFNLLNEHKDLN